jgi:hypothetical protein
MKNIEISIFYKISPIFVDNLGEKSLFGKIRLENLIKNSRLTKI